MSVGKKYDSENSLIRKKNHPCDKGGDSACPAMTLFALIAMVMKYLLLEFSHCGEPHACGVKPRERSDFIGHFFKIC